MDHSISLRVASYCSSAADILSSGEISVPNSDVSAGSSRFSAPRTALMAQEYIQPGTGRLCSPVTSLAVVKQQ